MRFSHRGCERIYFWVLLWVFKSEPEYTVNQKPENTVQRAMFYVWS